jgi:mRNA m6A methyltransferase catalytic subunit
MSQGGKKIELYGRPKNCMPGWVTLGNQLPGIYLYDEEIRKCYKEKYPNEDLSMEKMEANKREM